MALMPPMSPLMPQTPHTPLVPLALFALLVLPIVIVAGCGDDDGCPVVCAKSAECQPEGPGEDACLALCRQQSEDEAYAEAIELQAECYEEGWTCAELAGGVCDAPE